MIRIITDSTCDLSQEKRNKLNIDILPLEVLFGEESFVDGVDITAEEFYKKLKTVEELPKTAQVTPYAFQTLFEKYIQEGDEIVGIFISNKMSGTYQSAIVASKIAPDKIHIIDSMNVTVCLGLLVEEAVKLRDQGFSSNKIVETIESLKEKLRLFAIVDTLKYLQMGGRISSTAAIVGTILDINPIIGIYDGFVESLGKTRGKKAAYRWIENRLKKEPIDTTYPVCYGNTDAKEMAAEFKQFFDEKLEIQNSYISEIGPVVGTHAGPGAVCIAYFTK